MSACSALEAADFSRRQTNCDSLGSDKFLQSFCYACRNIMLGLDKSCKASSIPAYVQQNVEKYVLFFENSIHELTSLILSNIRERALAGIQEYLIDNNTD